MRDVLANVPGNVLNHDLVDVCRFVINSVLTNTLYDII